MQQTRRQTSETIAITPTTVTVVATAMMTAESSELAVSVVCWWTVVVTRTSVAKTTTKIINILGGHGKRKPPPTCQGSLQCVQPWGPLACVFSDCCRTHDETVHVYSLSIDFKICTQIAYVFYMYMNPNG